MPALLINIKIEEEEKYELFRVTLADLCGLFDECHVKIRGTYSNKCIEYIGKQFGEGVNFYQDLDETDWLATTLLMLKKVASRSVFLYFEDHRLVASKQKLKTTFADFDNYNVDYMCYSFFKASKLGVRNLLPLGVTQRELFHEFYLTPQTKNLIGKISPGYYTFSLVSLISVKYFEELISARNKKIKIFSKWVTALINFMFSYPRYRAVFHKINFLLSYINATLCIYPPSSPFNLEHMWFESIVPIKGGWKIGINKDELFANYDDDNGFYGESLIKRGLYPLTTEANIGPDEVPDRLITSTIMLSQGQCFDISYHAAVGRIRKPPIVFVKVEAGRVLHKSNVNKFIMQSGEFRAFYSNKGATLEACERSVIQLQIYDELL